MDANVFFDSHWLLHAVKCILINIGLNRSNFSTLKVNTMFLKSEYEMFRKKPKWLD